MKKRSIRNLSLSNRLFYIFNAILWITVMFAVLYPLYLICIASISDPDAVMSGKVTWRPVDISFIGYKAVFENKQIWVGYANSLFYTITSVIISVFATLAAAYTMSRRKFPGKKIINLYFVITMFFNGGLIPTFLILKNIGLYDTRLVMILNGCVSVWNLMVARTYIQNTIPEELYEASVLDGATHFQFFGKIVLPLSKTILAVLSVYYGVAKWNSYFDGLVYIRDKAKLPLQTVLRDILAVLQSSAALDTMVPIELQQASMEETFRIANASKYCLIVVAVVPVIILYLALQKYFEKGVMIGSLKG